MSEPDFDIDAAAAKFDSGKKPDDDRGHQGDTSPRDPSPDTPAEKDTPPGFDSYDEYVSKGGDPDMYRGKKAYVAEHERIDENKRLRREVKDLTSTVQQTVEAVDSLVTQAKQQTRAEIEGELSRAMEDEDPKAAVAAQKKLDSLDGEQAKQKTYREPDVIRDFRDSKPLIDQGSDEFDAEFNADMTAIYNDYALRLSNQDRVKLSDAQMNRLLRKSYKEARELHELEDDTPAPARAEEAPERSARNDRRATSASRRRSAAREPEPRAEDFKIDNPRNNRDYDASSVRDMIQKRAYDNAIKAGKSAEDATEAGVTAAGNFERSLAQ